MWCAYDDGNIGRRCKPREKLPAGSICVSDEQCELGAKCVFENPFESNNMQSLVICRKQWSRNEGESCNTATYDGSDSYECKDGACINNICVMADDNTLGLGCTDDAECGRGMTCDCPPTGAGRMRCMYNYIYGDTMLNRNLQSAVNELYSCLDTNGCQFLAFDAYLNRGQLRKGSCAERNCNGVLQKIYPEVQPSYDNCPSEFTDDMYADYEGMDQSWNSASQHAPVLAVFVLSIAALFAMH